MIDVPTVALIGNILLFISSIAALLINRREGKARARNQDTDTLSKLDAIIDKVQTRADKLYDEKVACELASDKLRGDLATALVTIAELKEELATKNGYIQGITNPLVRLEEKQREELRAGRRATDK